MKKFILLLAVFIFFKIDGTSQASIIFGRINSYQVVKLEIEEQTNNIVSITRTVLQDTGQSKNQCNKDNYTYYTYALGNLTQNISGNKITILIPNDGNSYWVVDFRDPNLTNSIPAGQVERTCCCSNG